MRHIDLVAFMSCLKVSKKAILVFVFALGALLIASSEGNAQNLLGGEIVRSAKLGTANSNYFVERTSTGWKPMRLEVSVSNVKLPADTVLAVFLNSSQIGTIKLSSTGTGFLRLAVKLGHRVPTVAHGASLSVKNGSTTILSGTFTTVNEAEAGCEE